MGGEKLRILNLTLLGFAEIALIEMEHIHQQAVLAHFMKMFAMYAAK